MKYLNKYSYYFTITLIILLIVSCNNEESRQFKSFFLENYLFSKVEVNKDSTITVELAGEHSTTAEGKYYLRFDDTISDPHFDLEKSISDLENIIANIENGSIDLENSDLDYDKLIELHKYFSRLSEEPKQMISLPTGKYKLLNKSYVKELIEDYQIDSPEEVKITWHSVMVKSKKIEEKFGMTNRTSNVYEIKVEIGFKGTLKSFSNKRVYNVTVSFPNALKIARELKTLPRSIPKIIYKVNYYPDNRSRGGYRIIKDIALIVLYILIVIIGILLVGMGLSIGVLAICAIIGAIYYLVIALQDLLWILFN